MVRINNLKPDNKEALKFCLENINPTDARITITIKDLRQIDKICSVIESSNDAEFIDLEDADFNYLKNKFDSYNSWNPTSRKIILDTSSMLDSALKSGVKIKSEPGI